MKKLCPLVILLLLLLSNGLLSQIVAIKAGNLIDPATESILPNQIIVIENSKIRAVGSNIKIPENSKIIDLSDFGVLPGLIDVHTHLCTDVDVDTSWRGQVTERFTSYILQTSTAYRALTGVAKAQSVLQAGFTTVRDVGNAGNYADTDLRKAIENGLIAGPTIINSGRIIAPYGGQLQLNPERPEFGVPEYFHADSKDELRKAIRENIHFGAKVIKLVVDDQPYIYSVDDLKFIVTEAALAGIKVAAHCHTLQGAINSIEAGVASIEHGSQMNEKAFKMARDKGVVYVGTEMPKWILKQFGSERAYPGMLKRLQLAYKLDVTIAYGSDALYEIENRSRGEMSLAALECWLSAAIPNAVTLKAMTTNGAKLLGIDKDRGAIIPGLAADIIAVKGNPLEDIQVLNNVVFVMKNGQVYRNTTGLTQ